MKYIKEKTSGIELIQKHRKSAFLSITIIFLSLIAIDSNVSANPIAVIIPDSFNDLCFGPRFNETSAVKLKEANVTIDVYDTISYGIGNYLLVNLENESVVLRILFLTEFEYESKVEEMTANGTKLMPEEVVLPNNDNENYTLDFKVFTVEMDPYSNIDLFINWTFQSGIIQPDLEQRIFHTGYSINGGEYWGGHPIEHEQVRFNFHTENFFTQDSSILVNLQNDSIYCVPGWAFMKSNWMAMIGNASEEQVNFTSEDLPFYVFSAENISESISIHIMYGIPSDKVITISPLDDAMRDGAIFFSVCAAVTVFGFTIRKLRRRVKEPKSLRKSRWK